MEQYPGRDKSIFSLSDLPDLTLTSVFVWAYIGREAFQAGKVIELKATRNTKPEMSLRV
jgi:hypothetical protein